MNQQGFLWLWEHMTDAERDRFVAHVRKMIAIAERLKPAIEAWENAGIEAAEKHANGER